MLFIFTTCLLLLVGVSLAILLKKLSDQKFLEENEPLVRLEAGNLRPLFAPSEEDLRRAEAEKNRQLTASEEAAKRQENVEKLEQLAELRVNWAASPTRGATMDILHRSSQLESGDAYLATCEAVLRLWRDGKLADIPAGDLAQLFETHFWLLPAEQRTPGAGFRLKQAVSDLRKGEENAM